MSNVPRRLVQAQTARRPAGPSGPLHGPMKRKPTPAGLRHRTPKNVFGPLRNRLPNEHQPVRSNPWVQAA